MYGIIKALDGESRKGGSIEWVPGVPEYETIRDTVGGLIQPVDLADIGNDKVLTVWCNEEGLIFNLPPAVEIEKVGTLRGNLLVSVTNLATGETEPVPEEIAHRIEYGRFYHLNFKVGFLVPILKLLPAEEVVS